MLIDINNLLKSVAKEVDMNSLAKNLINVIEERSRTMEDGEYSVDRIEGKFAVCENRNTREMVNIELKNLPEETHEGSILKYLDGIFYLDKEQEKNIENRIKEKMDKLWNN